MTEMPYDTFYALAGFVFGGAVIALIVHVVDYWRKRK